MVFKTWSSKPVSPTPWSRARAHLLLARPSTSRSPRGAPPRTPRHAAPDARVAPAGRARGRERREGRLGSLLAAPSCAKRREAREAAAAATARPRRRRLASRLTAACGLCRRCASEGGGAGSATNSGSVAGTSPSAPRGRSGRFGDARLRGGHHARRPARSRGRTAPRSVRRPPSVTPWRLWTRNLSGSIAKTPPCARRGFRAASPGASPLPLV